MANILITYYKVQELKFGKILAFWDGLFKELKNCGNNLLVINTAYFNDYNSNVVKNKKLDRLILDRVDQFKPDLIITFNHRIPYSILETYKDIPSVIWDGDALEYFCDLKYIKENIERYKIFSISESWEKGYIDFGFKKNQIYQVPPATAIYKEDIPQDIKISFLGGIHYDTGKIKKLICSHKYEEQLWNIQQEYLNSETFDYEALFCKYFQNDYENLNLNNADLWPFFNYRWLVLANLLDLGLKIYGLRWDEVVKTMPQITTAFFNKNVWSLEDNQEFYNRSVISISPIHPQGCGSGFPWRIYDVMASNACLVSEHSSDLKKLTSGQVEIPMFHTPWQAREICQDLLKDDTARYEIITASQKYVDNNARWIHHFKNIEDIMNIKIINENQIGNYINIDRDLEFQKLISSNKTQRKMKLKDKIRYKIWKQLDKTLKRKKII